MTTFKLNKKRKVFISSAFFYVIYCSFVKIILFIFNKKIIIMSKKLSFEEFVERSNKTHENNDLIYDESSFNGSHQKVRIICQKHGEFWQIAKDHMNGQGCPICGREKSGLQRRSNTNKFISSFKELYGDKLDLSKFVYTKSNIKSTVICPIHGEFEATPNNLLRGRGCPTCGNINKKIKQTISEQVFDERMEKIYGDSLTYNFSNYSNFGEKMEFVCSKHGSFEALPLNVLHGHGCPICGREKCSKSRTMKFEEVLRRFKEVHGDTYTYDESTYKTSRKKMRIICPKHGEFWQIPMNHWGGQGCPVCKESKLEMELDKALTDNGIEFIRQKPLGRQSIDFYIPKYKINIECQGEQHFKKKFDDKYDFKKSLERDIKKNKILRENGEKLIYFTKENLLPKNIEDPMFCNIYNKDNLFYSTESIINILK